MQFSPAASSTKRMDAALEKWTEEKSTAESTVYVKLVSSPSNTDSPNENIYPVVETIVPDRTDGQPEPQEGALASTANDPLGLDEKDVFSIMQSMCRICGSKGRMLMPITEVVSEDNVPVIEQIEAYLPLKISDDEQLPSEICAECVNGLNSWHRMYVTCVATDAVLHDLLQKEDVKMPIEQDQNQDERLGSYVNENYRVRGDVDSVHFGTDSESQEEEEESETKTYSQDLNGYENEDVYPCAAGGEEYADKLLIRGMEEEACEAAGISGGAPLSPSVTLDPNEILYATYLFNGSKFTNKCADVRSVSGSMSLNSGRAEEGKPQCKYVKLLVDCGKPSQGENTGKTWAYVDFGNESVAPTAPEYLANCAKVLSPAPKGEEEDEEKDSSKLYQEIDRIMKKLPPLGVKARLIELIKCNSLPKGVYTIKPAMKQPLPVSPGRQKKLITCDWCSEQCEGTSGLVDHKSKCRDLPVLCEHCGITLPRFRYLQHQRRVIAAEANSLRGEIQCKKCGKGFKLKVRMERHRCKTPPPKQSKCDNCGKIYRSMKLLERHVCPYLPPCEECGVTFQRELLYLEHQILHGFTPVHYCEICYKVFTRNEVLQFHLKSNKHAGYEQAESEEGTDNLTCKVCGIPFKDMASLAGHLNTPRECECPVCHTIVRNERLYLKHNTKCQRRVCKFCSKVFEHHYKCLIHERMHTGYRPFQCDMCGKSFTSKRLLISHKPVHLAPSCVCQLCGATFKWRKNLNAHIVYHHEGIKRVRVFKRRSQPSL